MWGNAVPAGIAGVPGYMVASGTARVKRWEPCLRNQVEARGTTGRLACQPTQSEEEVAPLEDTGCAYI